MADVTLELDTEHQARMQGYGGWRADQRRYLVFLDGAYIGVVESVRTESWRKSGRIRTSLIGRPKEWWATAGATAVTRTARTRQTAIDALVEAVSR